MKRVVVTGVGVLTPIGFNAGDFARGLREAKSGICPITKFETADFPIKRAFEIRDWTPPEWIPEEDPFIQYALAVSDEAFKDAAFNPAEQDPFRAGVVMSSSKGGVMTLDAALRSRRSAKGGGVDILNSVTPDRAAHVVAGKFGIKGPIKSYIAACATGTVSIVEAVKLVAGGEVDYCLAGATDASITPLILAGYHQMGVYSRNGMHPFDLGRSGFVAGEGAGCIFLESLDSAEARGAKIYGEVIGTASAQDSFHPVKFSPEAGTLSKMLLSLCRDSGINPREIDYLNTHGAATREGDIYETREIKKAFGKDALDISYSSTKSMVGHMLGAAGSVEFIACLMAIRDSFIPPTISYERPDPECDLDYTPNKARDRKVEVACSISMAFGGHAAGIMVKKQK